MYFSGREIYGNLAIPALVDDFVWFALVGMARLVDFNNCHHVSCRSPNIGQLGDASRKVVFSFPKSRRKAATPTETSRWSHGSMTQASARSSGFQPFHFNLFGTKNWPQRRASVGWTRSDLSVQKKTRVGW